MKTTQQITQESLEKTEEITDDYGQLHEDYCDLNAEGGSHDGCDCAMQGLTEEIKTHLTSHTIKLLENMVEMLKEEIDEKVLDYVEINMGGMTVGEITKKLNMAKKNGQNIAKQETITYLQEEIKKLKVC